MPEDHPVVVRFESEDEATKFKSILSDLRKGYCGLRSIALALRNLLRKARF